MNTSTRERISARFREEIEKRKSHSTMHICKDQSAFDRTVEQLIESAVIKTLAEQQRYPGRSDDELKASVVEAVSGQNNGPAMVLRNNFSRYFSYSAKLEDISKQEAITDWKDKGRFLLFRMLTAVGIAAVVLGTGWIAHHYGIPLPMLRLPPS